jgi:hypothetical protein
MSHLISVTVRLSGNVTEDDLSVARDLVHNLTGYEATVERGPDELSPREWTIGGHAP